MFLVGVLIQPPRAPNLEPRTRGVVPQSARSVRALGSAALVVMAAAALALGGCRAKTQPVLRFAGDVQPLTGLHQPALGPPPSWTLRVEGITTATARGPAVAMKITNRGLDSIQLSAVIDRFFADLDDGGSVELEEESFRYPSRVLAGSEEWVALLLPKGISPKRIVRIRGTIDDGRLQVALTPKTAAGPARKPRDRAREPNAAEPSVNRGPTPAGGVPAHTVADPEVP